ncbi:MAG: AMP-dependent synthetase [Deltaproteobacteria bacterium]|nr:AMP-dependent synthetase [Deltaproteobacteria bacterium]
MNTQSPSILSDLLAVSHPTHPALIVPEGGPMVTYSALHAQVEQFAATLHTLGIGRGDRVAMALPNGVEVIIAFLGIATAAATAAPLNPAYTTDEFRFYLEDIDAKVLIVPPGGGEQARAAAPADTLLIEASLAPDGQVRFEVTKASSLPRKHTTPTPDDVALFLHTSGTTSRPKGVPLSHANLLTSAANVMATYTLTPEDVSLCVMPLFHVHGLVASTLATFRSGGTLVVPARFSASSFWPVVKTHRATWYTAVPTIHQVLLARADEDQAPAPGTSGLRFIRSCSSALAPATMAGLENRFGCPVLEAYGMTEAAHQMASNPLPPAQRKPGSVGQGTGVQVAIMDDAGALLPTGSQGEVVIQGANVTRGYHNNPEANATSFTHGWFRTGDQGIIDAEGYLTLVGRLKELINRGGEKISPREIDEVLLTHPAVAEAVCFGVPDTKYGEEVAAVVVLRGDATEATLVAHCRERLSAFKVPKMIYMAKEIPRTATGKIQRRNVAAAFASSAASKG